MLCERCKKEEATIHLTEIIKDIRSEVNLCESCAREVGLNSKLSKFSLSLPDMFSFLEANELTEHEITSEQSTCKICGTSFSKYARYGKLGCSDCYKYLEDSMSKIIKGYHGDKKHAGKMPVKVPAGNAEIVPNPEIVAFDLSERLQKAVAEERYEEAALLRDEIKFALKQE